MLVNQALSRRTRDIFHAFDENREAGFFLINARTSAWIIQSRRGRSRVTEYSQVRVDASPTIRPFFFLSALKPLDSPFFSLLLSILSRKSCELFFLFFFFTNNFDDGYGSEIHLSLFEKLKVYDTIFFLSFFFFSIPLLSWIEIARNLDIANIIGSVARFTIVLKYLSMKYLKRAVFVLKWNRRPINAFENGVKIYRTRGLTLFSPALSLSFFFFYFFNFLWDTCAK